MKTILFFLLVFLAWCFDSIAQDQQSKWTVGADLFNRYVWRGTEYGNSPVVQPSVKYSIKGFSAGAWGNYSLSSNTGATEADLLISYAFNSKLSLAITDYYFPLEPGSAGRYFDYKHAHLFETTLNKTIGKVSLAGNWYFACANNDLYFEACYPFRLISLFGGAGNRSYTKNGEFNVVNLGIASTRSIPITEKFTLPLTGKIILNPNKEQIFIVIGISL